MNTYRSLQTIEAVQFQGDPIPGVTCDGNSDIKDVRDAARLAAGCDGSRAHLPHVHTRDTGGMRVVKQGDWIMPSIGGPFKVAPDNEFRAYYEIPSDAPVDTEGSLNSSLSNHGLPPVNQIRKKLKRLAGMEAGLKVEPKEDAAPEDPAPVV